MNQLQSKMLLLFGIICTGSVEIIASLSRANFKPSQEFRNTLILNSLKSAKQSATPPMEIKALTFHPAPESVQSAPAAYNTLKQSLQPKQNITKTAVSMPTDWKTALVYNKPIESPNPQASMATDWKTALVYNKPIFQQPSLLTYDPQFTPEFIKEDQPQTTNHPSRQDVYLPLQDRNPEEKPTALDLASRNNQPQRARNPFEMLNENIQPDQSIDLLDQSNQESEVTFQSPTIIEQRAQDAEIMAEELAAKSLLESTKQEAAATAKPETKLPNSQTNSLYDYFAKKFTASAQALQKSPEKIKAFVQQVADTLVSMTRLSDKQIIQLNDVIEQEVETSIDDPKSFVKADAKTFTVKFNSWLKGFVDKCYQAIGKSSPIGTKIVSIQTEANNPFAPNITFVVDKNGIPQSAQVDYNNYSYPIYKNNIVLNTDGSFAIQNIPIFDKKTSQTVLQKPHQAIYDNTLKNTITAPLETTETGQENINTLEDLILADPSLQNTSLSITYHPEKSIIIQERNLLTDVISTKQYTPDGKLTSQKITIPTIAKNKETPAQVMSSYQLD